MCSDGTLPLSSMEWWLITSGLHDCYFGLSTVVNVDRSGEDGGVADQS